MALEGRRMLSTEWNMAAGVKSAGVKSATQIFEITWKIFNVVQCLQKHVYVFIDGQYTLWSDINMKINMEMCFFWWHF